MGLIERRHHLMQEIKKIDDEQTLEMLENTLAFYNERGHADIADGLTVQQINDLTVLINEPAEKDTISESEFKELFARWNIA